MQKDISSDDFFAQCASSRAILTCVRVCCDFIAREFELRRKSTLMLREELARKIKFVIRPESFQHSVEFPLAAIKEFTN